MSADADRLSTATVSNATVAEVADQTVTVWKTGRITAAALIVAMAVCVIFLAVLSRAKRRRSPAEDNPHPYTDAV